MGDKNRSQTGFALLMSLIVVSIVVSIGLVVLDVTIKQVKLASNSTDSELAFHAANAGMECALYWRRAQKDAIEGDEFADPVVDPGGDMDDIECFDAGDIDVTPTKPFGAHDDVFFYEYQFTWDGNTRCSEVDMLVVAPGVFGGDTTVTANQISDDNVLPGYPAGQDLVCTAGSFCTAISVKGYNRSCTTKDSYGTVQREVLLEL